MQEEITFYAVDYASTINWYVRHLGVMPVYVDSTWAVFIKDDTKLSIINQDLVKLCEAERKMSIAVNPNKTNDDSKIHFNQSKKSPREGVAQLGITLH